MKPVSKYIGLFLFPGLLLVIISIKDSNSQNFVVQSFRVTPVDVYILEGTDTLLRCEISNQAGKVQWTKDGFALGFSAIIPGYPRYSVMGNSTHGVYNLQISNTTLDDDAEYQCQVGPAKGNPAIRANAKLNIIAAPTSIRIQENSRSSKIEVIEKQNLTLNCVVENAKPAAEILWFRGNMEYTGVEPKVQVIETPFKTFTTTSSLTLQPTADDDYKEFSCQAKHRALPPDMLMRANIHVSVLYPPGSPFLEGYTNGDHLRNGQQMEIACRSRGGNPPAQLVWYKNGKPVSSIQKNIGRLSENVYKFVVEAADDTANLTCEAKNILSIKPLQEKVQLSVYFSPLKVSIFGPTEAVIDEACQLSCITEPSNPFSEVKWSIDGHEVKYSETSILSSPKGGWITVSNISILIGTSNNVVTAICFSKNSVLKDEVFAKHTINVLRSPSPPILTGYNESQVIFAGSIHKLGCSSYNGNPPPNISWYKNDKKINSMSKINDDSVISELTILANSSDNLAHYKCLVESPAIDIPLFVAKALKVYFPPEKVKIRIQPKILRPGVAAKLICESSSSNPPAVVTWWRDGIPVNGVNPSNQLGLWGGTVSALELHINITHQMNEVLYTCQSLNEAMQRSVHETVSLDILCPPKFDTSKPLTFIGVEGESLRIPLVAIGNPTTMSFIWTKDGFPIISDQYSMKENNRIIIEGSVLNILKLQRTDSGIYMCEATNSEGSTILSVIVAVEYAPYIVAISEFNSFAPGQNAVLSCFVKGEPLNKDHVRWARLGYDMATKTTVNFVNGTSYLNIKNVQYSDIGNFTCMADNQRGAIARRDVLLIVESAPKVEKLTTSVRFTANIGERGLLKCHAEGTPTPVFVWQRNGKDIRMYRRNKYTSEEYKINEITWGSNLYINQVLNDDYGVYECIAKNSYGQSSTEVQLIRPTRPESPQKIFFNNITNNSVQISWIPGFDGGLPVYYRIRYKELSGEKYTYVEACSKCLNTTIFGLTPNTEYTFSVMAINDAGGSKFLPDVRTKLSSKKADVKSSESIEKNEMPNLVIIGITSAAMVLLVLNAALVAWFVIRRQNKGSSDNDHQTDDTYSKDDNQAAYKNANHKKATSTYLVENVDIIQSASFPPKYQESSLVAPPYTISTDYTKTLPNPKRHTKMVPDNRSKDDHMLVSNGLYIQSPSPASSLVIKGSYISSPSPAPPSDGSYFNMSDKYLSYPPVVY